MALKHVGRLTANKRKIVVVNRVIPGQPDKALVVQTENLEASEHDALMKAVEGNAGQEAYEFGECMARTYLPDGRNMLAGFHATGRLRAINTTEIEMTPDQNSTINLQELNEMIAEQRGVTVADLALKGSDQSEATPQPTATPEQQTQTTQTDSVLSDEDLAAQYRSQADAMFKEAKRLREEAELLVPTKRKKKTEESA